MAIPDESSATLPLPPPLNQSEDDKESADGPSVSESLTENGRRERPIVKSHIVSKLIEGLTSGPTIPLTDTYLREKKKAFLNRRKATFPKR